MQLSLRCILSAIKVFKPFFADSREYLALALHFMTRSCGRRKLVIMAAHVYRRLVLDGVRTSARGQHLDYRKRQPSLVASLFAASTASLRLEKDPR